MKRDAVYKGIVLAAGLLMEVGTVVAPLFLSVPGFVAANVTGTAFVAFALGPVYGGLFALGANVLLNYVTGGGGSVGYVLAVRAVEAFVIGWIGRRRRGWSCPVVASLLNAAVIPTLTLTLAFFGGSFRTELGFVEWFGREYAVFLRGGWLRVLQKYLFSCLVGYVLAVGMARGRRARSAESSA